MSAIFDFSFFQTLGMIWSNLIGLPDVQHMGTAVGISLISFIQAEIRKFISTFG